MSTMIQILAASMFLVAGDGEPENPWRLRVAGAAAQAERSETVRAYADALDAAWRGDDCRTGLRLALAAQKKHPNKAKLRGLICRALWRGGRMLRAEEIAAQIDPKTRDRAALSALIQIHLARGEFEAANAAADQLSSLAAVSAGDLFFILTSRMATGGSDGLAALIRKALKLTNPKNGYPETLLTESLEGLPEFLEAVGPQPLNQIQQFGSAPMPVVPVINLPGCTAMINGKGPYRLIVDTGGSITLSLDTQVAEEIGLKLISKSSIRGVSGTDISWQASVDELRIGGIVCTRVMTRVFGLKKSIAYAADGIIGTGMFADGRMTLDFARAELKVGPSREQPAPGVTGELRIVGDAKLMAPIRIEGDEATALLDSGADIVALSPGLLKEKFPGQKFQTYRMPTAGIGAGEAPAISFTHGVKLDFGQRSHENVGGLGLDVLDTTLSTFIGIQCEVLIGMPIFRQMSSFTVDFPRRKMWIEWLEPE